MKYFYKINSLNSVVNQIPSGSSNEEYLKSYGSVLYNNIFKNCFSSNCYNVIDTLKLSETQINNYCTNNILNIGGKWNLSDDTEYNKLSIINNELILNNSTKIEYTMVLVNRIRINAWFTARISPIGRQYLKQNKVFY